MDIVFYCPNCHQELEVDAGAAGSSIECPSCKDSIVIPEASPQNLRLGNTGSHTAEAKVERHFKVRTDHSATEPLIQKANKPLEVEAQESDKVLRIKTIRRSECIEVGHDHFDSVVTKFLGKVGEPNIVSIHPVTYSAKDLASEKLVSDYGVLIIYRG